MGEPHHGCLRKRRPSRVTVPEHSHPVARLVFAEMRRQGVTYFELAERSGLARETIIAWRQRNKPDLESIEAVLGVLGLRLAAVHELHPHQPVELIAAVPDAVPVVDEVPSHG